MFEIIVNGEAAMAPSVYIDNDLVLSKGAKVREGFKLHLRTQSSIKGLGDGMFYMGCHISRNMATNVLQINQRGSIGTTRIAEPFRVTNPSYVDEVFQYQRRMAPKRRRKRLGYTIPYLEAK